LSSSFAVNIHYASSQFLGTPHPPTARERFDTRNISFAVDLEGAFRYVAGVERVSTSGGGGLCRHSGFD